MGESVTFLTALGAGLASFLSPCILPMVPVYLSSLYGPEVFEARRARLPVFLHSLSFVAGFSIVFVLLGAIVGLTGYAVIPDYNLLGKIAGGLLIAFGVFILLARKVPWLNFERHLAPRLGHTTGYLRSLLIGAAFSVTWTACVGPILGSILAIAATKATAWQGAYLLAVYAAGLGLPFLIVGAAFDFVLPLLKHIQRYSGWIHLASALLLITVGALILAGQLTWFASLAG